MEFKSLNKEQRLSATFRGKHLLVLAGAGTGKTTTIISRVAWLLEQGVQTSRIKIISFTKKSASDIASRAQSLLGSGTGFTVQGSTFHGWCLEIIRTYPAVFGMQNWNVIDADDQESVFRQILSEPEYKSFADIKTASLIALCSYMVNTGISLHEAISRSENCSELPVSALEVLFARYSVYKKEHHYFDYDDLITVVVDKLRSNDSFRQQLTSRYDHILVDEMQDTNHLQWNLLEQFAPFCSLFCVGDDAQSIYGFRGADFNSIHSFAQRIPDSQVIKLVRNYRSSQPVLDVANALLENSPLDYDKSLVAMRKRGVKPRLAFVHNQKEEAEFIMSEISRSVSHGGTYSDNMLLVRSSYQARQLESVFMSHGIPYRLFGGTSIVRSSHIRDVMAAARLIVHPDDELAWIRYLSLWKGIGKAKAQTIISRLPSNVDIVDKISFMGGTSGLKQASQILLEGAACRNDASSSIRAISLAMTPVLALRHPNDWERREKDLDMVIASIGSSQSLEDFISTYLLDTVTENSETGNFVTVSTIHSAKGLEAENVYILDVTAGNYPPMIAVRNGQEQIEEERRCLYVALTRARKSLCLLTDYATWSMTEPVRTDPKMLRPGARFISNRPEEKAAPLVFIKASIVSLESDYVCFHTDDGRTGYSLINDFIYTYRPEQEKNPPLMVPHFLLGDMDIRLFEPVAYTQDAQPRKTVDNAVHDYSFF